MPVMELVTKSIGLRERILGFQRAMSAEEVAKLLGVHVDTIYRQARKGDIPSFRVGTSIKFDPKHLAEWYTRQ